MKTMNDERVGWKEIEAWDVHLTPAWRPSLYTRSLVVKRSIVRYNNRSERPLH